MVHDPSEDEGQPEIVIQPKTMAGVWANWAHVSQGEHEFTVDFVRMDPVLPRGIVVARVSGSSLFFMQLIATLTSVWQNWAAGKMPPEVHGQDEV